jgi:hypothetical protein
MSDTPRKSDTSPERNQFCRKCGTPISENVSYCPRCGNAIAGATAYGQPLDWRAQRRAERRNRSGLGVGGIIVAAILVVAGMAIFFPQLPLEFFWGSVLILLGGLVAFAWSRRTHNLGKQ